MKELNLNSNQNTSLTQITTQKFDDISKNLTQTWPQSEGHDILASISRFNQIMLPHGVSEIPHAICVPRYSTYSPWKVPGFYEDVLKEINPPYYQSSWTEREGKTLVDIYRVYGLYQALLGTENLPGECIEIGVYKGGTAAFIGNVIKQQNSSSHLYVADTFKGVVNANEEFDTCYVGGEHSDTTIEGVRNLLNKFTRDSGYTILQGIFPESAPDYFKDLQIRFAHIDVDVYQGSIESYEYLYPLMPSGAIAIFDDFATQGIEGVTRAVHYIQKKYDVSVYHMFNGQAMVIKL